MENKWREFSEACGTGDLELVKSLSEEFKGKGLVHFDTVMSPLLVAMKKNHHEISSFLLDCIKRGVVKFALDMQDEEYYTAFQIACLTNNLQVVKGMMQIYLSMEAIDYWYFDPNLTFSNLQPTPFSFACMSGCAEVVKYLLGIDCIYEHETMRRGTTPLMRACIAGHERIVEIFLRSDNVDFNVGDKNRQTAFFHACKGGHTKIVSMMLNDFRVNPNIQDCNTESPLHMLCRNNNLGLAKMLIDSGRMDVNMKTHHRMSPFDIALSKGYREMTQLFIKT